MKLFPTRCQFCLATLGLLLALALAACQPITRPDPTAAPVPGAADSEQIPGLIEARQLLAQELQVDPATITVVSTEVVDWSDGCLGAGGPAEICAAVITPGVKVIFESAGVQYEYRLSADGLQQRPAPAP